MNQLTKFSLGLFCLFLIGACGKDDDICTDGTNFTYLKEGNKWTYDLEVFLSSPVPLEIEAAEELETGVFRMDYTTAATIFPEETIWAACGSSISLINSLEEPDLTTNIFTKKNPSVGETWSGTNAGSMGVYTVVDKNVSITTPAGTFTCDKITVNINGAFNVDTLYQSDNAGLIKYDGLLLSYELISKNF